MFYRYHSVTRFLGFGVNIKRKIPPEKRERKSGADTTPRAFSCGVCSSTCRRRSTSSSCSAAGPASRFQSSISALAKSRPHETCPVRSLQGWLEQSAIAEGPVFRPITRHSKILKLEPRRLSGFAVSLVVKRYAAAAGWTLPDNRATVCAPASRLRRDRQGERAGHHEPDRPHFDQDGAALHSRRQSLPG